MNKITKPASLQELAVMANNLSVNGEINFSCDEDSNFWALRKINIFDGDILLVGSYGGGLTSSLDLQIDGDEHEIHSFLKRVLEDHAADEVFVEVSKNSYTYWDRLSDLNKEIKEEIIKTIKAHNLTEVEIADEDGLGVSVMWHDRYGDIHDSTVLKVVLADDDLSLIVDSSEYTAEETTEIECCDFAFSHTGWLSEIFDCVDSILNPKEDNDGE